MKNFLLQSPAQVKGVFKLLIRKLPRGYDPRSRVYKTLVLPNKLKEHLPPSEQFQSRVSPSRVTHPCSPKRSELDLRMFCHRGCIFFSAFNACLSTIVTYFALLFDHEAFATKPHIAHCAGGSLVTESMYKLRISLHKVDTNLSRRSGTRTRDLIAPNDARYQLRYTPINKTVFLLTA